jgi:hypothetical protein
LRLTRDPSFEPALADYLASADLETTFRVLSSTRAGGADAPAYAHALEIARQRFGARVDAIERSLAEAGRMQRVNAAREAFSEVRDRLVTSVLLSAENREQVLGVLRSDAPEEPTSLLHAWVDACGLFSAPDDVPSRITAHAMIDGASLDEVMRRLRETFPDGDLDASVPSIRNFYEASMFAPLARASR